MDITRFNKCVKFTMVNEGGYSDQPGDKGGPTSRGGVTLSTLRRLSAKILNHDWDKDDDGDIDAQDLALLTDDDLRVAYGEYYDNDMDSLRSDVVAMKVFDLRYNCGPVSGTKLLQKAINSALGSRAIVVDGDLGPRTVNYANSISEHALVVQLIEEAEQHYKDIVAFDPTQAKWLRGWMNRTRRIPSND